MTDAVVQRVADLIRLASNDGASDSEARTAALVACRLIAKHGLRVVGASADQRAGRSVYDAPQPGSHREWWHVDWSGRQPDYSAADVEAARAAVAAREATYRAARAAAKDAKRRHYEQARAPAADVEMRLIHSRFETRCKACMNRVAVGDEVWWQPGRGVWHDGCRT